MLAAFLVHDQRLRQPRPLWYRRCSRPICRWAGELWQVGDGSIVVELTVPIACLIGAETCLLSLADIGGLSICYFILLCS